MNLYKLSFALVRSSRKFEQNEKKLFCLDAFCKNLVYSEQM